MQPAYDPEKHCGAHPDHERGPCRHRKGAGTNHLGDGRCKWHGGRSPQAVKAADRRNRETAAVEAVQRHALPRDIDPADALLEEVRRTAGVVDWLHKQILALDPDDIVWGKVTERRGNGAEGEPTWTVEHRAAVNMWWKLWTEERDRGVRVNRDTLAAGIDERRVRLAEQHGAILVTVIRAVLADLNLTPEQRALVATVVPRHLRAVTSAPTT